MNIFTNESVTGNMVKLNTTHKLHFSNEKAMPADDNVSESFGKVLNNAINKVNNLQVESEELAQKMITQPESVDIHSVMIAAQKAEIALTFTKTVRDEAIRAYRELMTMR